MQPQSAATTQGPIVLLMVPPPLMFAFAFGVGAAIHRFVPLPPAAVAGEAFWAGAASWPPACAWDCRWRRVS